MVRPDSETYRRGARRAPLVTLALNVMVVAGKLIGGLIADGLSVIFALLKNVLPDFPLCNKSFNRSHSSNYL